MYSSDLNRVSVICQNQKGNSRVSLDHLFTLKYEFPQAMPEISKSKVDPSAISDLRQFKGGLLPLPRQRKWSHSLKKDQVISKFLNNIHCLNNTRSKYPDIKAKC